MTRTPITILTGFLGAGKTTLLNRALRAADCPRLAIVVNEFGAVPIDHDLVERSDDDVVLLAGGCACCSVRADLAQALARLTNAVRDGRLPAFEHIVVETTGLADPTPIEQLFMAGLGLERRFELRGIVTVVDALLAAQTSRTQPVWSRQVALADRIIVTKSDGVDRTAVHALLDGVNRAALRLDASDPALGARALLGLDDAHVFDAARAASGESVHDENVRAFSAELDEPIEGDDLVAWLDTLVAVHGQRLLRLKGLVNVAGEARPLVVHAAQHFKATPRLLDCWPRGEARTRLTFIGAGLAPVDLQAGLPPSAPRPRWQ